MNQKTRRMVRSCRAEERPFNPFSEPRKSVSIDLVELRKALKEAMEARRL